MADAFPRGRFLWFELLTTDPEAAVPFYREVVGWDTEVWEGGESPYTMWTNRGTNLGGIWQLTAEALASGASPHWLAYIAAENVEATAARATELGATVMVPPSPIPGIGIFSVIQDPQGAFFAAYAPEGDPPGHDGKAKVGEVSWHELITDDFEHALDFYAELFGWRRGEAMDMGEAGIYQMYHRGGEPLGGMFNRPPEMPSAWLYYLCVEDLAAAVAKVTAHGGKVLNGPMEVPGGDHVAQCLDPQGAAFALHQFAAESG